MNISKYIPFKFSEASVFISLHSAFVRVLMYMLILFLSFFFFIKYSNPSHLSKTELLTSLISVISILLAVLITYLFSKLFSEKALRVERKKQIDFFAQKITALRKIAFHIRSMHEFWRPEKKDYKSIMDKKYQKLTYDIYFSENENRLSYEQSQEIEKDTGIVAPGYLALKGLEDGRNSFYFFHPFILENYSLEKILRFKDYTNSFWYFLNKSNNRTFHFQNISTYELDQVDEVFFEIEGKRMDANNYKKSLEDLFSSFDSIYDQIYYLTKLNTDELPEVFSKNLWNLLIFLVILSFAVVLLIVDFSYKLNYLLSLSLASWFLSNTFDLVFITFQAIKAELDVKDFYNI